MRYPMGYEITREARGWLADCAPTVEAMDRVAEISDDRVWAVVSRYFIGGITAFCRDYHQTIGA